MRSLLDQARMASEAARRSLADTFRQLLYIRSGSNVILNYRDGPLER